VKKLCLWLILSGIFYPALASADGVTANAGIVSEYVFRGLPQTDGRAAAQGGIEFTRGNISVGTWVSMVKSATTFTIDNSDPANPSLLPVSGNDGIEVDLYASYGSTYKQIDWSIGATYYTYTDNFDDDYKEINLGAGWKWFTLDFAAGEWDAFAEPTQDYTFVSLTSEYRGIYVKLGDFSGDFGGSYIEAGFGSTLRLSGRDLFDYSISYVNSDQKLADDNYLLFGIVKSFDLFKN